jgi:hydroxypyruvate reductase
VKKVVEGAFRAACARVDLAGRVRAAIGDGGPFVVIAAGKAAAAMASGVTNVERSLVVVPRGATAPEGAMQASHPLPDESSLRAAEAALEMAACDSPHERLFLISGGASSLLCAPCDGLSLGRKREIADVLLRADAPIDEVNLVRRHLSRIKGGGLARACGDRARRTLVVSDVLSNALETIGSGPSVRDPSTVDDARAVAARRDLGDLPFVETWKHDERAQLLATPLAFAELVAEELTSRGIRARASAASSPLDVEQTASRYTLLLSAMPRGEAAVIAAEPVVSVPTDRQSKGHARGGRCSHLAALMSSRLPERALFAAIATDGVDGASGTGGAIIDGPITGVTGALDVFATGPLHIDAGTALPSAPTGINFADIHILLRA